VHGRPGKRWLSGADAAAPERPGDRKQEGAAAPAKVPERLPRWAAEKPLEHSWSHCRLDCDAQAGLGREADGQQGSRVNLSPESLMRREVLLQGYQLAAGRWNKRTRGGFLEKFFFRGRTVAVQPAPPPMWTDCAAFAQRCVRCGCDAMDCGLWSEDQRQRWLKTGIDAYIRHGRLPPAPHRLATAFAQGSDAKPIGRPKSEAKK